MQFLITLFSLAILLFPSCSVHFHRMNPFFRINNFENHFKSHNKIKYDQEVVSGFKLGEQIMIALDKYRKQESQQKLSIKRTDRMKQLCFELVNQLRNDIDKFNKHPGFLKRAKRFNDDCYYAEFVAKVFSKQQFTQRIIKAWSEKSENSKKDLQLDYNEGAAYCISYQSGYLCAASLIRLPDKANSVKAMLIPKPKI